MKIQRSTGDNGKKRECSDINQGGTAGFRSLRGRRRTALFIYDQKWRKAQKAQRRKMADKKLVEAITSMSEDFAQWYTDVVKKAELIFQCKGLYGH